MKALLLCCSIALLAITFSPGCHAETKIKLFKQQRRSGDVYEWWISPERLKATPKWHPLESEPPFSLKDAIKVGEEWIKEQKGGGKGVQAGDVQSITIDSFHQDTGDLRFVFYYRIVFEVQQFDRMACIVLMDGTILKPDHQPAPTNAPNSRDGDVR